MFNYTDNTYTSKPDLSHKIQSGQNNMVKIDDTLYLVNHNTKSIPHIISYNITSFSISNS